MARKLRVQYEGAIYHVTIRGVERRSIFDDPDDRERFLDRLGEAVAEYGVRLYLFCLMTNHAHLLMETPQGNLSAFMHKLQTAYTVYYNLRHKRAGHLTQGRFNAKLVAGDKYMLTLSRYIHLNPVCIDPLKGQSVARRRAELRAYRWSSYRGYTGLAKPYEWVAEGPILAMMGRGERKQRRAYGRFVEGGLVGRDDEFLEVLKGSAWGIGGSDFQARVKSLHADMARQVKRPGDVSFRRIACTVSPEIVLDRVAARYGMKAENLRERRYDCVARAVAAYMLVRFAGMNQRDVGEFLNVGTGSAVYQQLKRLRARRMQDSDLVAQIDGLEAVMDKEQGILGKAKC